MKDFISRYRSLFTTAFFFAIAALLYLPFARHAGYFDDDWFAMYAAKVAGPGIFHEFYILESRPGREWVVAPLYALFHGIPFYYALSAYVFRTLGALAMLWTLHLVWPNNRKETFLTALLFLVYPGYLSQPTPVDFQSYLIGIWIAFLSLAMSLKGILATTRPQRILFAAAAVLSGWFYLSQIEYYIGFEAVRLMLIAIIFWRTNDGRQQKSLRAFKSWLPYAVIPAAFLTWRLLFFEVTRKATDVGLQLGRFTASPVQTSLIWLFSFSKDIVSIALLAWSVPLAELAFNLDLSNSLTALGLSLVVLILFFALFPKLTEDHTDEKTSSYDFGTEALWLGMVWVVLGLLPVIVGNRHFSFLEYSRYGLVSAGGAVLFLVAVLGRLSRQSFQRTVITLLLISATLTHYGNAVRFARQMDNIRSFWWQVSWRVPQFKRGATIVAHYPLAGIRESTFVWGPANQIYYPFRVKPDDIVPGVAAILLDETSVMKILNQDRQYMDSYYAVSAFPNPRHITVLTQPNAASCVQVIDGTAPEYSRYEDPLFLLVSPHSEIEQILTDESPPDVPETLFGPEPEHGWCYYYEKAALARQRGDWDEVLRLADEARDQGLSPADLIEWIPFLQAYALHGRTDELINLSAAIQSDEYVARQVCQKLTALQTDRVVQDVIASQFCVFPK
jgi:hypothetical protein